MRGLELDLLDAERRAVAARAASSPVDPDAFVRWFAALREDGPGQGDALFPWLATRHARRAHVVPGAGGGRRGRLRGPRGAGPDQAADAAEARAGAELLDEMGQGVAKGTHGGMLATLARELDLHAAARDVAWESLAVGNLMLAMAGHRAWAYHCLGALGAIELTAPTRMGHVHAALRAAQAGALQVVAAVTASTCATAKP
ncbi:MAG: iron-containing redox enzyme family protein [Myxococcota bacterium]